MSIESLSPPSSFEQDRLERVQSLAADSGEDWAKGFEPGSSGCRELLDRTNLVGDMLENYVLNHPSCVAEAEWYSLAAQATEALRTLYQRVGAKHLS